MDELRKKLTPEEYHVTQEKGELGKGTRVQDLLETVLEQGEQNRPKGVQSRYETEAPFSGEYYKETAKGKYNCKVCGNQLFSSDTKYHSDVPGLAGWPSFDEAIPGAVEYVEDTSLGMSRVEVVCANCKAHLGHIFDDAEAKTGKHFCINSCALNLKKEE
jgi:peptide-methionine (R)-S-oxide reductase